jgi:two-component system, LytTR family, response regulator
MKIKCIVIDDEIPAIEQMTDYIERVPFLECIGTFDNAIEPVPFLKTNPVDMIFLDVEMEGFTGIQFLKTLRSRPKIVLTTAYDSYAIAAFDLNVTDYLLKPISFERFIQAVEKVYDLFRDQPAGAELSTRIASREFIFVKTEFRMHRIDFASLLYIEGKKEYLCFYTRTEKIMVLQSFAAILKELPADNFYRIHKSYIVAIDKIDRVEKGRVYIGEHVIPVSETYKEGFALFLTGKRSD